MFPCEVFNKSPSTRPWSVRFNLWRIDSNGLSHWAERRSALVTTHRETIVCIAFLEKNHRSSSRSVANLNRARLGQNLKCGRREGEIVCYLKRTSRIARVPTALSVSEFS